MNPTLIHDQSNNYECTVTFTNGEHLQVNTSQLHPHRELWSFTDWHCNAGADILMIAGDMTVYSCNSKHDNMGNLLDPNFKMFKEPVTCSRLECQIKNMDLCCTKYNPASANKVR